jgi:undecaprenyl-diphosphatase
VLFDLFCHLGTLLAVLFFLKSEITDLFRSERKKLALLFIALLPLIPSYFLLKPLRTFLSKPEHLGVCLMATSAILFLGGKYRLRREDSSSMKRQVSDALWIGAMQSAALIPGISRSASTVSCARVLGWEASKAVRFSFLLSIPTIIGGNCLELLKIVCSEHTAPTSIPLSFCLAGFLCSCITGFLLIRRAIAFLEKGNPKPFAWYCLIVGACAACIF